MFKEHVCSKIHSCQSKRFMTFRLLSQIGLRPFIKQINRNIFLTVRMRFIWDRHRHHHHHWLREPLKCFENLTNVFNFRWKRNEREWKKKIKINLSLKLSRTIILRKCMHSHQEVSSVQMIRASFCYYLPELFPLHAIKDIYCWSRYSVQTNVSVTN